MLSSIRSIDNLYEVNDWNLGDLLGEGFESFIIGVLTKQLSKYFQEGVRLFPTSKSRDDGRDAVITSPVDLVDIFNQNLKLDGKKEIKIYVECKSSNTGRISLDKVMGSVSKIKEECPNYYIFITNTSITPYAYHCITETLRENNIKFILIDQSILVSVLNQNGVTIGLMPSLLRPDVYVEYQILTRKESGKNVYDLFLLHHNLTSSQCLISQQLLSDRNWDVDEADYSFILMPSGTYVKRISIIRMFADGIDDLLFSIKTGDKETQIHIQGSDMSVIFETPLFGADHYDCVSRLTECISTADKLDVSFIWGEAGVGKTRVFRELFKRLDGQNFDFGFFSIKKNKNTLNQDLQKFLESNKYLPIEKQAHTFYKLIAQAKNNFRRAVILIDDCHNASDTFWNDIKALLNIDAPISIILCGRTDYSVGTVAYFTFVQWSIESKNNFVWQLEPLTPIETKNFVRSIIHRVPETALDRICKLSRNNPLFIVQFIEYLLELKLVAIINRSAVGITNTSTFSSKLYIPEKVHGIYEQRLKHLYDNNNGTLMADFLFILSLFEGRQAHQDVIRFFNEKIECLNLLIKSKFVQINEDGEIVFEHESLLLFFRRQLSINAKLQRKIANLIFNNAAFLLEDMNKLDKGCVAYWAGNRQLAKDCFSDVIEHLHEVNNQSAFNINAEIHDYLIYVWEIYKKDANKKGLLGKVLKAKIYISLHHFNPVIAIADCDHALKLLDKSKLFNDDIVLRNAILEQKAHCMVNAGFLNDSELLMKKLLSDWIIEPSRLSSDTVFDLFDRLSGIYTKLNCKKLSQNYNELSFREAQKSSDQSLIALAYLNRSKLHYFNDYSMARESLENIFNILSDGTSRRILCLGRISFLTIELLHNKDCDYQKLFEQAHELIDEAIEGNYSHAVIKIYLILAITDFIINEQKGTFINTQKLISKGIDCSIKYGIPTNMWQFYNLLGIVQIHMNLHTEDIWRTFETVYALLAKQDLLCLGNLDLCYGNILALSNIGFFLQSYKFENDFYKKMASTSHFGSILDSDYSDSTVSKEYTYSHSIEKLKCEYKKARKKQVLFIDESTDGLYRDKKTGYFIPIS